MQRRSFVLASVAAGAAAKPASIPRRTYKPGVELSIIGFGGIVVTKMPQAEADRRTAEAFDKGINYFDCAPSYFDGEAEIQLGNALKPYRQKVFLAEKTTRRDAAGAREELEQTLRRFHTDHVDLYQFHAVSSMEDVEKILAPGGAAETYMKARQEGKLKYLGLSAHHAGAAIKLMDSLPLDSILFPVNFRAWSEGHFGPQILEHAKKKGMARMALKALAMGLYPKSMPEKDRKYGAKCWYEPIDDPELARMALRFTLNQEITAAIPPGEERIFDLAVRLASEPLPALTAAEQKKLLQATALEPVFRA